MKRFLSSVIVLVALFKAEADTEPRTRHRHHEGGGQPKGEWLQAMVDTQCTDDFDCSGDIDCTFEKPERPVVDDLDGDDMAQLKTEMKAKKKEVQQKMLKCACCAQMSVEDILVAKGQKEEGSRPFGSGRPGKGDNAGFGKPESEGSDFETKGDWLQAMVDTQCTDDFDCNGDIDCTFEKPERPVVDDLDGDGMAQLKTEMKAKKEECRQKMLKCACCAQMSVEDILAAKGQKEGGSRPFGSGRPGKGGGSRPQSTSGGRPGEGWDIQEMLAEKCTTDFIEQECPSMPAGINCDRFDSMNTNTRGRRRKNLLYCGCCQD